MQPSKQSKVHEVQGESGLVAQQHIRDYYASLEMRVENQLAVAKKARRRGLDMETDIETKPVQDLADRTEAIIGPPGIAARYRKVYAAHKGHRMEAIFQLFREIIEQKWCKIPDGQKRVEQAIKTALVINTEGVVVAPLDGVPRVEINKNPDGSRYIDIYYAGPIRAAGGTSTVLPLILGDYARKLMGLERYKPTRDEVERYVEEIQIYESIVSRQHKVSDKDVRSIIEGCPVCINGEPTEKREVSVHRDLSRIPHNRVRGGMCLVVVEGVSLKAQKILKFAEQLDLDWRWLEDIIKFAKPAEKSTAEISPKADYLGGVAAGRPIFGYPSRPGSFRLRYGRARGMGIMAKAVHPATVAVLDDYIALGTQLKVERPGKAAGMCVCDSIEGPTVLLKNGAVKHLSSAKEAQELLPAIKEILFLGDILISYGDFRYSAHPLVPAGYCEEWWQMELEKAAKKKGTSLPSPPSNAEEALSLSQEFGVPLHPGYTHYYGLLDAEQCNLLLKAVAQAPKTSPLCLPNTPEIKAALEKIGLPHTVEEEQLEIDPAQAPAVRRVFGKKKGTMKEGEDIHAFLSSLSGLKLHDKAGTFIGARMGRPEAAGPREMKGNPHVLFPVGNYGGATRSLNKALERAESTAGQLEAQIAAFSCQKCRKSGPYPFCPQCRVRTEHQPFEGRPPVRKVPVEELARSAADRLGVSLPALVKGVKGMINEGKFVEPIEKGILRARHDLHLFRDGTIRFEVINNPLSHFKPEEINATVESMHALGYTHDMHKKPLEHSDQMLEMLPQDIILPESAGDFFVRVSRFLDEELERFYGLDAYYNVKDKEALIGEIFLGLAPHTSAAIVGRLIGYSKGRACFAHPYFHQTKRRNCLAPDTPILINEEQAAHFVPIGSLDPGKGEGEIPLEGIHTFTIDKKGDMKREKVTALFKKKAPLHWLNIKTRYGRTITATPKQKILIPEKGKVGVKHARDLQEGEDLLSLSSFDKSLTKTHSVVGVCQWYKENSSKAQKKSLRLHGVKTELVSRLKKAGGAWALIKKLKYRKSQSFRTRGKALYNAIYWDSVPLDLYEELETTLSLPVNLYQKARISYKKQKSHIPAVIPLDGPLGEVVGYYLGDGYARTNDNNKRTRYVYQTCFVSAEKSITSRLIKHLSTIFKRTPTTESKGSIEHIMLSGRVYYDFFTRILGTGINAKNKRIPKRVLNANTACKQGCLAGYMVADGLVDRNCLKTSSVNSMLTNDFAFLATRLNLFPHVFKEKKRAVKSGYLHEFYKKKKKVMFTQATGLRFYSEDFLKIAPWLFGKKKTTAKNRIKTRPFSKKRVKRLGRFVRDRIVSIEKEKTTAPYVYDLMVEGEKTFVGGFGNLAVYDCDGDQDSVMLLLDGLLNFSNGFISAGRGGRMDAPLVFTVVLNPQEIDNEVYDMEICAKYPLSLYENAAKVLPAEEAPVQVVEDVLGKPEQYSGFSYTHDTAAFDGGPAYSQYVQQGTMADKMRRQARLQQKIRAVDQKDALERVLVGHFMPDIIGNTRSYGRQKFRCTACQSVYRRLPLAGKCTNCNKDSFVLTINEGSVRKYLDIAMEIINEYQLSDYLRQRLELIEDEIDNIFKSDTASQTSLSQYV